ncbi:hypothetical protein NMA510612_1001 [Neisseria meningitidis]|uniref:Uncharacterized protein n=2 Tax=Neisseria meningitidis TaxID=487 RepID=A0A0H5QSX0_NEIMI|nr:hypothetical protein NMA510612_1001 [Neisseria meningitidis]CRY98743.1 FIG00849436: hypothetical protein [Neisseria meningitidis serogroup B]
MIAIRIFQTAFSFMPSEMFFSFPQPYHRLNLILHKPTYLSFTQILSTIQAKNHRLLYNSVLPLNLESEKTICAAY